MTGLVSMIDKVDASEPSTRFGLGFADQLLKELRRSKKRRPDLVLRFAPAVLRYKSSNEAWSLREQLFTAAVDIGDHKTAKDSILVLLKKFPKSSRVRRLHGMLLEAEGRFKKALDLYSTLLQENPSNLFIMKRKVCVHKALGDVAAVIAELNLILKYYPSDVGSWRELGDLFLSQCCYQEAAHCFVELVLLIPDSAPHHTRLAEAYYTLGGPQNLLSARKHYCMSLNIQSAKFNARALYGLILTCKAIDECSKNSSRKGEGEGGASSSGKKLGSERTIVQFAEEDSSPAVAELPTVHELSVNKEMLKWGEMQLQSLFTDEYPATDSLLSKLLVDALAL